MLRVVGREQDLAGRKSERSMFPRGEALCTQRQVDDSTVTRLPRWSCDQVIAHVMTLRYPVHLDASGQVSAGDIMGIGDKSPG
jgi:hypothetical protein